MSIRELAEKYMKAQDAAWFNGQFDQLEAIEHEEVVYHIPKIPGTKGFEGHKQHIQEATKMYSDYKQQWEYLVGDENVFAVNWKARAKMKTEHPILHIPAGKMINSDAIFVCHIKDEQIVEVWMNGSMNFE